VQAKVKAREDERDNYVNRIKSEHDTATRYVSDVARAIEPHNGLLRSLNVNPITAIEAVMNDAAVAYVGTLEQKKDLIARVMQTAGLTLADLNNTVDNSANPGNNGASHSSSAELAALQARLRVAEAQLQDKEQQSQQSQLSSVRTKVADVVTSLMTEKGQDGKPLRPHFDKLQLPIAKIAKSIRDFEVGQGNDPDYRDIMQQAYEIAVSRDPEIKAAKEAEQREQEQRKRDEAARAVKAQAMSTPKATGINGTAPANARPVSFREALTQELRKQS
jgi:hypothetical protein